MTAREDRQAYAAGLIRAGRVAGEIPRYGSRAWLDLPATDPRRSAAVVVAAECWAVQGDQLEAQLRDEITAARQVVDRDAADAFAAVAHDVRRRAGSPSWSDVEAMWAS